LPRSVLTPRLKVPVLNELGIDVTVTGALRHRIFSYSKC
jgi:hypothetical protein